VMTTATHKAGPDESFFGLWRRCRGNCFSMLDYARLRSATSHPASDARQR
jgi:hypothetical protein